jgi:hypothetical protein
MRPARILVIHVFHEDPYTGLWLLTCHLPGNARLTILFQSVFLVLALTYTTRKGQWAENKNAIPQAALLTSDKQ